MGSYRLGLLIVALAVCAFVFSGCAPTGFLTATFTPGDEGNGCGCSAEGCACGEARGCSAEGGCGEAYEFPLNVEERRVALALADQILSDLRERTDAESSPGLFKSLDELRSAAYPSDRQYIVGRLAREMQRSGLTSKVTFSFKEDGAVIRYSTYGGQTVETANDWTPNASAEIAIGFYYFWAESDSRRISKKVFKRIVRQSEGPIPLEKN